MTAPDRHMTDLREKVARAIAKTRFDDESRWPGQYVVADAAIAAMRPVSVQEAAQVLLGAISEPDIKSIMLQAAGGAMLASVVDYAGDVWTEDDWAPDVMQAVLDALARSDKEGE